MIQYVLGRKRHKMHDIDKCTALTDKLFYNERLDKTKWETKKVNQSTFLNMGFRFANFRECDFQHCIFVDCYFKNASFDNVKFTGCKFINCNFDEVALVHCIFDYATFHGCYIDFDIMHYNLPTLHNLRWKMCINMGMESLRAGNTKEYQKYFFEEKKASEKHYWELICQETIYYKGKYGPIDRFRGIKWLVSSKFNSIVWGYGERLINVIVIAFITIITFAVLYYNQGTVFKNNDQIVHLTLLQAFYHSLCSFFTLSSEITSPHSEFARLLVPIETATGIILMGFFVASIFRYINRRQ